MAESRDESRERLRPYVEGAASLKGVMFDAPSRRVGAEVPWDYMRRAAELVKSAQHVLDMGAGDGRRFSSICRDFRGYAVATEKWATSAAIAAPLLRPVGINLVRCWSQLLPFLDNCFDLVLNRHEELSPQEVVRVLRHGGSFLTQQWGASWGEIRRFFPRIPAAADYFPKCVSELRDAGLTVLDACQASTRQAYGGVGDIVTMLLLDGTIIPNFDPLGSDLEAVVEMERGLTTSEGFVLSECPFIVEGRKS
jgi:SAM-dependent methyltransferase